MAPLRSLEPVSPPVNGVQTALAWGEGGESGVWCSPREGTSKCGWLPALTLPYPWAGALGKIGPKALRECPDVSRSCPVIGVSMLVQKPLLSAYCTPGTESTEGKYKDHCSCGVYTSIDVQAPASPSQAPRGTCICGFTWMRLTQGAWLT